MIEQHPRAWMNISLASRRMFERSWKRSVQFPFDKPIPYGLISKIVKFRVKENLERAEAKGKKNGEKTMSTTVSSEQFIKASPAQVYYALTHAIALHEWLCDYATLAPRPGGRMYLYWHGDFYSAGEYVSLEENKSVVFKWFGRGDPAPAVHYDLEYMQSAAQAYLTINAGAVDPLTSGHLAPINIFSRFIRDQAQILSEEKGTPILTDLEPWLEYYYFHGVIRHPSAIQSETLAAFIQRIGGCDATCQEEITRQRREHQWTIP